MLRNRKTTSIKKQSQSELYLEDYRNVLSNFSNLPVELIVLILKFLDDNERLNGISLVSSHFWDISYQYFINTLYGHSLQFMQWEKTELEKLKNNFQSFKTTHQVTLFRPANRNLGQNVINYSSLTLGVFTLAATFLSSCLQLKTVTMINITSIWQILSMIITSLTTCCGAYAGYMRLTEAINLTAQLNRNFLQTPITLRHINDLQDFLNENKIFINPRLNQIVIGRTTVSQLFNFLEEEIAITLSLSNSFDDYFKSKKSSQKKFINEDDFKKLHEINPALPNYAKNTVTIWHKNNKAKESLIKTEVLPDETISNHLQSTLKK